MELIPEDFATKFYKTFHFVLKLTTKILPYIANRSRYKSFAVAELSFHSLENIRGWMVVLHGKAYYTGDFTGKILQYQSIRENRKTFPT